MKLRAKFEAEVALAALTPMSLILTPQSGDGQTVLEFSLTITPSIPTTGFTDAFGNINTRLTAGKGDITISTVCVADVPDEIAVDQTAQFTLVQDLPDDVLQYLLPSRYCQADMPVFLKLANRIIRWKKPGYPQVEAIRAWIQKKVKYKYGVSTANTSAVETAKKRAGVCRDFSHLGIALCRALRIPARIVVGYLHELDPMDLHAWFEAYIGGRWYTFDATQKVPKGNRIVIGYGRDAADVAQMSEYGPLKITRQQVSVE